MKKISSLLTICFVLFFISSCKETKLSNEEAKALIIKTLNLPQRFRYDVNKRPSMGSGFELDGLKDAGLITGYRLDASYPVSFELTDIGKSCYLGEDSNGFKFKTNDVDFDQIIGVSVNQTDQTAIVRFTVKATNVTLAGRAFAQTNAGFSGRKYINYSLDNPIQGEFVFKKFDNGWQLQTNQNKSSDELLNLILNGER